MFLRFVRGIYDRSRESELEHVVDEQYLPRLHQLPGFHSFDSGHQDGRLAAVIQVDTAEHAEAVGGLRGPLEATGLQIETVDGFDLDWRL